MCVCFFFFGEGIDRCLGTGAGILGDVPPLVFCVARRGDGCEEASGSTHCFPLLFDAY